MVVGLAGRQLKWADRDSATISIPAGTVRRLDLININEGDALVADEDRLVPVRVGLFAISASGREILASTAFTLRITVAGSNFAPKEHRISVSFSGTWPTQTRDWVSLQRTWWSAWILGSGRVPHLDWAPLGRERTNRADRAINVSV
jgi:hypothetical protein